MDDFGLLLSKTENKKKESRAGKSKNDFTVAELTSSSGNFIVGHIRSDSLTMLIVTKGCIHLSINQENSTACSGSVIRAIPENLLFINKISDDFEGKMISVNRDSLSYTSAGVSPNTYLYIRRHPVLKLTREEEEEVLELYSLIKKKYEKIATSSDKKVFHCLIMALYFELTGCINKRTDESPAAILSHKEILYKKFFTLLQDNVRKEHSVSFYANQLCLTPQYISAVLKELSGMSANKWIDEMLLTEAKHLLFSTEKNIQQIADELYFPDQSSFGKFFKKMTGVSPGNYKKREMV